MAFNPALIKRSAETRTPPRIVIHGDAGVGKTTFAASAPSPIFMSLERGGFPADIDVPAFEVETYEDAIEMLNHLSDAEHEYATIVVDTIDWLEPIIMKEASARLGVVDAAALDFGKGFKKALDIWQEFLDTLNEVNRRRGMAYILLAHTHAARINPPDVAPYDRWSLKLYEKAAAKIVEAVDHVGYAYKPVHKVELKTERGKVSRAVGGRDSMLKLRGGPSCLSKTRASTMPDEIPLIWESFASCL